MIDPVKTDLIPLLQNLVAALQPFAKANYLTLQFKTSLKHIDIEHHPEDIIPDLTQLLCRIITFTPQKYSVTLDVNTSDRGKEEFVLLQIINTGVNLEKLKNITAGIKRKISIIPSCKNGTNFMMKIQLENPEAQTVKEETPTTFETKKYHIQPFYKKLKEHLISHFTSIKNLEKAVSARSQREGVFLKKVNAIITANLGQEGFNTLDLARALALSRSQLYRRLKPLVQFAPAHYIRYVRLQKAKEFIENDDMTVGEAAFKTGFINQSHFTRTFREQFGFNPSDLRRRQNKKEKTNQN